MKLGEFIEAFSHNNIVRLLYKERGGHRVVLNDWNDVSMDHEITKGKGINRHYVNNEVLGLASVCFTKGPYAEAINIVIEEMKNQPVINEAICENTSSNAEYTEK